MTREVVTISLANYEERQQEIAQQLYRAAKDVGFFYISGEGGRGMVGQLNSHPSRQHLAMAGSAGRKCAVPATPHCLTRITTLIPASRLALVAEPPPLQSTRIWVAEPPPTSHLPRPPLCLLPTVPPAAADHGIPQEEVDHAFATGKSFLELDKETKAHYPFNPDTYLGWRGPDELETVTGGRGGRWG